MKLRLPLLTAALALVAFSAIASASRATVATTVKIDLAGPAINGFVPLGRATYQETSFGDHRLLLTVSRVHLDAGTVLDVTVDGDSVGSITLKASHGGTLFISESRGDTVPVIDETSAIEVLDAGDVVEWGPPDNPRYSSMYSRMSGVAISGKVPSGRASYRTSDFGFSRKVRVYAQSIKLPEGTTLSLMVNSQDDPLGTCDVNAYRVCAVGYSFQENDTPNKLTVNSELYLVNRGDPADPTDDVTILDTLAYDWIDTSPQ